MAALPGHLDHGDIEVEAGQFVAQSFAFCGDKESMQLLFKSVEILHRLARFAPLAQKRLELSMAWVSLDKSAGLCNACMGHPSVRLVVVTPTLCRSGSALSRLAVGGASRRA